MQVAINIEDEAVAQKVLWFLDHLRDDGVEIISIDDKKEEILRNFQEGLEELKRAQKGLLSPKEVGEFLNEL